MSLSLSIRIPQLPQIITWLCSSYAERCVRCASDCIAPLGRAKEFPLLVPAFAATRTRTSRVTVPQKLLRKERVLYSRIHAMAEKTASGGPEESSIASGIANLKIKLLTLVIIQQDGRVLLGKKKRGFGEGYYNGFGGKVEEGETVEDGAARELEEEAVIVPVQMEKKGLLHFHFDDKPEIWQVHVFHVAKYSGEPTETDEMAPTWFDESAIPFEKMWADDRFWYPHFLKGEKFRGEFYFENTHTLVRHDIKVVDSL